MSQEFIASTNSHLNRDDRGVACDAPHLDRGNRAGFGGAQRRL